MTDRVFSLLHLSLTPVSQPTFDVFRGTREEWLRHALSKTFDFDGHGGRELVWVPRSSRGGLIFGLIQGKKPYSYHKPPSQGGAETAGDFWQGAFLFLDPTHHDDGQKLAIENDVLGTPRALARSLFGYLNDLAAAPYVAHPELIFDEDDFWKFANDSGGKLKYIKFKFVVPNMWGPQNDLEEDHKETGKETGSDEVEVTLKGKNGVRADTEKVRSGVTYVSRGAGSISAKNMYGKPYSSNKRATTDSISDEDFEEKSEFSLSEIGRRVLSRG